MPLCAMSTEGLYSVLAFVLAAQVGGFCRQGNLDAQTGFVVVQGQATVVQGDDGADQRQAEAVTGGAARAVEADEAFYYVVAFIRRDAFAVIGDVNQDVVATFYYEIGRASCRERV